MALFDFLCYIKLVIYIPFLFSTLRTINLMGQFKFRFCQKGIILKMRLYVKKTKHANFKKLWLDSSRRADDIKNFKLDLHFARKTTHLVYIFHFCYCIFYFYK